MKNTKIMAVLVVLLAAMLFVGAASAGVAKGTIFVNEEVNLTKIGDTTNSSITIYKLSGDSNPVVLDSFNITNDERLLPSQVGDNTGVWYLANSNAADYIYIYYPEISLSAELANTLGAGATTSGDSIDGKTINTNTNIAFIIDAPRVGDVNVTGGAAVDGKNLSQVKIVFTTPAGGKIDQFGYTNASETTVGDFSAISLTSVQVTTEGIKAGSNAVAGTWTAQAEFVTPQSFKDYAEKSNTISFTLQSTALAITASKDSVIRSNPFTVTISGDSQAEYAVFLEGVDSNEVNPYIPAGQSGFQYYVAKTVGTYEQVNEAGHYTAAVFKTDASGNRVVQFNTEATTEDKTYTIRVSEFSASSGSSGNPAVAENVTIGSGVDYDTVKVKVEKGAVTITASGDGQYYIGQEITLSGTNTDSDNIFLFITGPNLLSDGVNLKTVGGDNQAAYLNNQPVSVKTDDTWEYKWDTSNSGLDTGSYTIYATSVLTNGKSSSAVATTSSYGTDGYAVKLSDSEYGTVSVSLKQPFLSATPSGTIVAKGDDIYIRGTAEGDPSKLQYYIFGPNKFETGTISVEDDGTYEKKLTIGSDWASNQYYVVIEHPMYNGVIDVKDSGLVSGKRTLYIENAAGEGNQSSFIVEGQGRLQSSNAANALTTMIDNANIDDVYTKLTFTVDEPRITITNPGDQATGTTFTISGTTNLAVGDQIIVDVQSSSFTAVDKSSTSITDGVSVTTTVVAGEGTDNVWSVEVDTTNWKLDEYTIKASGIEVDVTATTNFNLVEKVVTPTATATGATPTTTATATATATATPATPGFGAFVALAGLGAVALLVLRRN